MFEIIKETLTRLKPEGKDGFEGLVGIIINEITDVPTRIAKSGTQFGRDGGAIFHGDEICFEAKRYSGEKSLPKKDISIKLMDLANNKDSADTLWVLGTTTEVPDQHATSIRTSAFRDGISVLILDWPHNSLPLLAVALNMAKEKAVPWIIEKLDDDSLLQPLNQALEKLASDDKYLSTSQKLRKKFNAVELATANAIKANKEWMTHTLSEENQARSSLGQPISPLSNPSMTLPRLNVTREISESLTDEYQKPIFLLGNDGAGKSWIAASVMHEHEGLSVFISSDRIAHRENQDELQKLLINLLSYQCGQHTPDKRLRERWKKRLESWATTKKVGRILVVLDGLNQRPDIPWHKIIASFCQIIFPMGGHLIITARPNFFHTYIRASLCHEHHTLLVKDWSELERDKLLKLNGINVDNLDPAAATSLKNPRLLGIAIKLLPNDNLAAWHGLTIDRLLFEHIRLSQRDGIEPNTPEALAQKLAEHAKDVLERPATRSTNNRLTFKSDTEHVAEGRFFETVPGPRRYKLKEEGLSLALGYAFVEKLWDDYYDNLDLNESLSQILEPVAALDRTADIILASLTICSLDDTRFNKDITAVLLHGFSGLQNPNVQRYESFKEICFSRFEVFLIALENCFLEYRQRLSSNWLEAVAHDAKATDALWFKLASSISQWLSYYSTDPEFSLRGFPMDDLERWNNEVQSKQTKIAAALKSCSNFESLLLSEMLVKEGNLNNLAELGLQLLTDKPLAPFARSFLKWGVSLGINAGRWAPREQFLHLAYFNLVDWAEMSDSFQASVLPLEDTSTSKGGLWTVVRMLYATGVNSNAKRAKAIATELRIDRNNTHKSWRLIEDYCATDPCDPNSEYPANIAETEKRYSHIDVDEIFTKFGGDQYDFFGETALTGVARFHAATAIAKHQELLATLPNRKELSLRQLALNGTFMMPLVSAEVAKVMMAELKTGANLQSIPDNDRSVTGLFILGLIFQHLTANQQIEAMSLPVFNEHHYMLSMMPHLKPFHAQQFSQQLTKACDSKVPSEIISTLAFLQYTDTVLEKSTEDLILSLITFPNSIVRACTFDVILKKNITEGVRKVCNSGWFFDAEDIIDHEALYGSLVLIEAHKLGLVSAQDIFKRCSMLAWIKSINSLKKETQLLVMDSLDIALDSFLNPNIQIEKPDFNIVFKTSEFDVAQHYSLDGLKGHDNVGHPFDVESHEDFEVRQENLNTAFLEFRSTLSDHTAALILNGLTISDLENLVSIRPEIVKGWASKLLSAEDNKISLAQNLCYIVARLSSEELPNEAIQLLKKAQNSDEFMTVEYVPGLNSKYMCIWKSHPSDLNKKLLTDRLNNAKDDQEIALEVLAAETCNRQKFILNYVNEGLQNDHPYIQARAITVAGFSNQTDLFFNPIENLAKEDGLTGDAAKTALEALNRCIWSKHWFSEMVVANTKEEFWCNSRLLVKIADYRLDLFIKSLDEYGQYWPSYRININKEILRRSKKWQDKRAKTILGLKLIDKIYI